MDDSRIYLGVVCGRGNEGGRLPENVGERRFSFKKFQPLMLV